MSCSRTPHSVLRVPFRAALTLVMGAAFAVASPAQTRLDKYTAQYQQETDPVRKAKLLGEMGPLEVDLARDTFKAGKDEQALDILTRYNDEVQKDAAALDAAGVDPVSHPNGFKELQIGLRVSIRRLDEMIETIPVDKRPWFRSVRSDLSDVQNKLIDALFRTKSKPADGDSSDNKP